MSARVLRSPLFLATAGIWLLCWLVWTVDAAVENVPHQLDGAARGFLCDVAGALLCGGIYRLLQRLERRSLAIRLDAMVAFAFFPSALLMAADLYTHLEEAVRAAEEENPAEIFEHYSAQMATLEELLQQHLDELKAALNLKDAVAAKHGAALLRPERHVSKPRHGARRSARV